MSWFTFYEITGASVPTPATSQASIFINSATGQPSYKDDTGTVTSLVGIPGPGVPVGGTAGQALTKIDGTDYNTQWTSIPSRTPAVQSVTSSATVTPTFSDDIVLVTAQAAALALANPTGTAIPNLGMVIRIKDNGTARAISYDTQYRAIGVTLPTTTVINKTVYLAMIFNSTDTRWDVLAVGQEA